MTLKDIRVLQKTDFVRLTAQMSKVTLVSLDFEHSHFSIDFSSKRAAEDSQACQQDAEIRLKITGVSMTFSFEQWLEAESQTVEEDHGIGFFEIRNLTFAAQMEPFINQEKFRLRVLDNQLTFQDHLYSLRTPEGSHFEGMIEQFAGVFSEHMKQQMLSELSIKLAAKT